MDPITFPSSISGFSLTEYLTIFISLIFALAVAEYFISIGKILKPDVKVVYDFEYLLWIFALLDIFLVLWYLHWPRIAYMGKGLVYYFLLVFPYLVIFTIVSVFFPDLSGKNLFNMKEHFQKIRKTFFALLALYFILDTVIDLLMPATSPRYALIAKGSYVILSVAAVLYNNRWIRYVYLALFGVYLMLLFVVM